MKTIPLWLLVSALALAPAASAGSADAPEITDDAGDCAFAPGNEYMDIVAAWISDESGTDFVVNLALAKFLEPAAHAAGYTVQFTHQGVQWGVVFFYQAGLGWSFMTGRVSDEDTGGFNGTEGAFTPGEPAVLSATFPKDLFPHTEAMDHEVTGFWAGSIDMKAQWPFFFTAGPTGFFPPAPAIECDEAESDAVYVFQKGQHAMNGMDHGTASNSTGNATASAGAGAGNATLETGSAAEPARAADPESKGIPGPGTVLVLTGLLGGAALGSRRRDVP